MNSFVVTKKESIEKQREIEKQQEITTWLMLQLRKRDKQIEEIKQRLKGNRYNVYIHILFVTLLEKPHIMWQKFLNEYFSICDCYVACFYRMYTEFGIEESQSLKYLDTKLVIEIIEHFTSFPKTRESINSVIAITDIGHIVHISYLSVVRSTL